MRKKIEGNVFVQFTVSSSGKLTKIKIVRSLNFENFISDSLIATQFNNEALRIISLMPDWEPGLDHDNKPVEVPKVTVLIRFKLNQ